MAFPLDPTNGQQTTQNGILYIYNASLGVWAVLTNTAGNISANNVVVSTSITSDTVTALGNIDGANIVTAGEVSAVGNIAGSYFLGNGALLSGITVDSTSIQNGNSNVQVLANSVVNVSVAGTANVATFETGGVNVAGNVQGLFHTSAKTITANATIANINAVSAGPITIADGVTVTIGTNGDWSIV